MKTPRLHTLSAHESPRTLLSIVAAVAIGAAACSAPPAEQSAAAGSTEPAAAQGQPPAAAPQGNAAAPANPQPQAAPAPPPARPTPRVARLTSGQTLTVRMTRALSTKTNNSGDVFSAILEEPISVDDWVVAPAGARVEGRIVAADDGGRVKGRANLSIELTSLTTGDGRKVEIVTTPVSHEAAANKGKDAKRIGIGAGAGAAVGAIAGGGQGAAVGALIGGGAGAAMRGDAAEIPAETVVSFELRSPVTIEEKP